MAKKKVEGERVSGDVTPALRAIGRAIREGAGPAFPAPATQDWSGMSLREYLAGQALQGMGSFMVSASPEKLQQAAVACRKLADALLLELAQSPQCDEGGER